MICLVCEPLHLRIEQPINSFQRESLGDPPDPGRALTQHAELVATLERLGVRVVRVRPTEETPYQVFTRDVVIGGLGEPLLATLREPLRQPELAAVRRALEEASIPFVESRGGCLEGGDVVAHGCEVFVGIGDRTDRAAADWLRERCYGEYDVHVLEMKPGFLHLDMIFNVLGDDRCVLFAAAFSPDAARLIRERFSERLEVDATEQRGRSTNFLPIGEGLVVASTTMAARVRDYIRAGGSELFLVEFDEIQKAGGSVRCSTCLLDL